MKQILYFNLPYDDIVKNEERPKLLYAREIEQNKKHDRNDSYLIEMLNMFEHEKAENIRLANVVLLKVPVASSYSDEDGTQVVGGYASDGWTASQETYHGVQSIGRISASEVWKSK